MAINFDRDDYMRREIEMRMREQQYRHEKEMAIRDQMYQTGWAEAPNVPKAVTPKKATLNTKLLLTKG